MTFLVNAAGKAVTFMVEGAKHVLTYDNLVDGQVLLNNETVGVGVPQAAVDLVGEQLYEAEFSESGYSIDIDGTEYIVIEGLIAPKPTPYARLYRRVIDTTSYLVDPDGKLVAALLGGDAYAAYANQSGTSWLWAEGSQEIEPMTEACGGSCLLTRDADGIIYCGVHYNIENSVLSPEVAEWVDTVMSRFYAYSRNTGAAAYGLPLVLLAMKSGKIKCAGVTVKNVMLGGELQDVIAPLFGTRAYNPVQDGYSGSLKAIIGNQYQKGMRSLLYDDNWYEQNVLGLTTDDIVSVGEYDYNNNEPGNSIEIPRNVELTLPSYVPKVIVNTNPATGPLNEVMLYSSVEAQDVMSDIVLVSQNGNVTFVENDDEWNIVQNSNNIGTCTAEDASISLTTSNTSQITSVLYNPA